MTRRDYRLIADTLREARSRVPRPAYHDLVELFAAGLEAQYANFDGRRFREACFAA